MKSKNICKFITEGNSEKIEIQSFICETDVETMKRSSTLTHNRAILVRQGSGRFMFDGKEYPFEKGCLFFGFSGEIFSATGSDNCEYMYIDFSGTRSESLFRRFGINMVNRCFDSFDGVIPLWYDSLTRASSENIDLASESVLLYSFSRLSQNSSESNDLVNKIVEITEEQFTNPSLSVSSIARELTYNAKYISHIFKNKTGVSYTEYLRTMRIKYAVSLLDHGIDSVKNIALLSGFSDPLYFSSVFKRAIGVSPKDYRRRTKDN